MPSLSPGTPGTKEAYGISIIRDDLSITIPPKACEHYGLADDRLMVVKSTTIDWTSIPKVEHKGETGTSNWQNGVKLLIIVGEFLKRSIE